jgi:hypothetical protein
MDDIFTSIINKPIYAFGAIILFWIVLFVVFRWVYILKPVSWKRLEFIWIIIGSMGLISIVKENNKSFNKAELTYMKVNIENSITHLENWLDEPSACVKYIKSPYSPVDLDQGQLDQDQICNWSKKILAILVEIREGNYERINVQSLDTIAYQSSITSEYKKEIRRRAFEVNKFIDGYNEVKVEFDSNDWNDFYRSIGVLFLIFAFGLRLAIATYNVNNAK